jgi:hypothetical protein
MTRRRTSFGADTTFPGSDLGPEEAEFARACDARRRRLGVVSLPYSEVLKVAKELGYRKVEPEGESAP